MKIQELDLFGNEIKQRAIYPYEWHLKSLEGKSTKYKAFGCFISCGGSSLGAKLAGFNHLGGVEIDKKVAQTYKDNLKPKFLFNMDIREFNKLQDLPKELFDLDVLEGSPPCKTFTINGLRQKSFGILKRFNEGQALQTLDDLVFEYADTIIKLKPKCFIFENVKGFSMEFSKKHRKKIISMLENEYNLNEYLLDSQYMGLPQTRVRYFIIGTRKDFGFVTINLNFNEKTIAVKQVLENNIPMHHRFIKYPQLKEEIEEGKQFSLLPNHKGRFNSNYAARLKCPFPTLQNRGNSIILPAPYFRFPTEKELLKISSFPLDYKFKNKSQLIFGTGMCVPPIMAANIFNQIKIQFLDKIKK